MTGIHLAVHGHFYQPPRENPWTEEVPVEPSAAPAHDWNQRIDAECYRPNGFARIVDDHGLVVAIVNNYGLLSFNVGPSLAAWLERHAPQTYERVLDADARHHTAIAQAYSHAILPLASPRDVRTQVRWGLADFAHRFRRPAAGMWLPETAVNEDVLAILVEEGVGFTILAPHQVTEPVEAGRAVWWEHPGGGRIALVLYDGPLSHDVAFGLAGLDARTIVDRAANAAPRGGLVLVATDGETFGHHHPFTERAVAYALAVEAPLRGLSTGPLERWLRQQPPEHVVGVKESAWSCAHGVGRWKEDCGCSTGGRPGSDQAWRAPLRAALDFLRDSAARVFEQRGRAVLRDPWAARDAYVQVILGQVDAIAFVEEHGQPGADHVEALTLLESQRHCQLMYASCGWFFHDLAGIETVQILQYAACVLDLLAELGEEPPIQRFLTLLDAARSNDPSEGTGRQIWERHVEPERVGPERVVGHLALLELLEGAPPAPIVGGYEVVVEHHGSAERGAAAVCAGRVALVHRRTRRPHVYVYAAMHLGAVDVVGATRLGAEPRLDAAAVDDLLIRWRGGERLTAMLQRILEGFGPREFGLSAALPGAESRILDRTAHALADRFAGELERLISDHRRSLSALAEAGYPLPPELRTPIELALARSVEGNLSALAGGDRLALAGIVQSVGEALEAGVSLGARRLEGVAATAVEALVRRAVEGEDTSADDAVLLLHELRRVGVNVRVDEAQELVYHAIFEGPSEVLERLGVRLGLAVGRLGVPR